ncbi:MAG: hypothetical protein LAO22_08465 [Acidobacteriia bacterium]|nr:hypothetical protein [Terriglobia bacterium]
MPTVMLLLGGLFGTIIGTLLAGGMVAVAGLPVYGPAHNVLAALLALGPGAILPNVVHPILMLFGAGLGLLVATIFLYAGAAVSVLTGAALGEFFSRGAIIGAASSTNWLIMSAIPRLSVVAGIIFIVTLLALIPPIAGNRFYERVLGALGWVLPLNYLMLPLGVLVFIVTAPFALAAPTGTGSVRWDWLTWTIETAGGAALGSTGFVGGFNIGNFTFISPGVTTSPAFTTTVSAHETGHTLSNSALGGFFYWIGAVDENVPPLRRMSAAYAEMLAESHFSGPTGGPFIPMW